MSHVENDQVKNIKEHVSMEIVDSGLGDSFTDDLKSLSIHESGANVHNEVQPNPDKNLEERGRFIFPTDKDGDNILHLAICNGDVKLALDIIDMADDVTLNQQNNIGQTPLMLAVLMKTMEIIRKLIDVGVDLEFCDINGNNIIHLAADRGVECSLREIFTISKYASVERLTEVYETLLEARNCDGYTPFHVAVRRQHMELAKMLQYVGANVNARDYKAGFTALHHLVENGNVGLLQQFIDEFHPVIDSQSYAGYTPLHLTMDKSRIDLGSILVLNGADPDEECLEGVSWSSAMLH